MGGYLFMAGGAVLWDSMLFIYRYRYQYQSRVWCGVVDDHIFSKGVVLGRHEIAGREGMHYFYDGWIDG